MSNTLEHLQGLHIELTNLCTLKCPGCARTQFIKQFGNHWRNHSLDLDVLDQFIDIDIQNKQILLCGNYGDPIYHPEFLEAVKLFKRKGSHVIVTTNGSYKNATWWEQLADLLDHNDKVIFSIDGVPENFSQYRINADWPSIEIGLKIIGHSDCRSEWKYIPFRYNQETIDQAQKIAENFGIDLFQITHSDRFDESTRHFIPDQEFLGTRYQSQIIWKNNQTNLNVNAECYDGKQHFITADGYYTPCCYYADHRFYYKSYFGKQRSNYSIHKYTLSQILTRQDTLELLNTVNEQSCCRYNCPKVDQKI